MSNCCEETRAPVAAACHAPAAPAAATDCCGEPVPVNKRDYFLWFCVSAVASLYALGLVLPHGAGETWSMATLSHGVLELLNQIWWGIALGVFFVGLLARIPRDLVMSVLGHKPGFVSLLRAAAAGVLLDLCSHGILAVGMKLYERGASTGQVMAFLLASPWNSFSLTFILIGLIGFGWTMLFILLSLVVGLITGYIFDLLVGRGTLPENPHRALLNEDADLGTLWSEFRRSWTFSAGGTRSLLADGIAGSRVVIRWGLFGILLAAMIRTVMPEDAFATWFGASLTGLWLTVLAATVIEVCSEGATPVAADLMNRAAAPGNAFTFLMAGVATDYTEVMSIRDTTSSWKIALFLPLVSLPQVLVLGYVLNHF